jgi:hypothetical protein
MTELYKPRHQAQLGRGTPVPGATQGSMDCGPRTIQMGIDQLTRGERVPDIAEIRDRMNAEGAQSTNTADAQRCVESYDEPEMGKLDRKPLTYYKREGDQDALDDAVKGGDYVHLAIDYGTFNDVADNTGDPGFRGGHSVGVFGWRKDDDGDVEWRLFDPLDDGRSGGIPIGPRWVKRSKLIAAWEDFGRYWGALRGGSHV